MTDVVKLVNQPQVIVLDATNTVRMGTALISGGAGGGGDVSVSGIPVAGQLAIWDSGTTIEGDPDLVFDGTDIIFSRRLRILGDGTLLPLQIRTTGLSGRVATFGSSGTGFVDMYTSGANLHLPFGGLGIRGTNAAPNVYFDSLEDEFLGLFSDTGSTSPAGLQFGDDTKLTGATDGRLDILNDAGTTSISVLHNTVDGEIITSTGDLILSPAGAVIVPRLTTGERDALTAVVGMLIYNTTLGVGQMYDGAWKDIHA